MRARAKFFLLIAGFLALSTPAMAAWQSGDWVLARWKNGDYWYPAVVQGQKGVFVTITYDDGTKDVLAESLVKRYDWAVGSKIACVWASDGKYYAATITNMGNDGTTLIIRYTDGTVERTNTGKCRSAF